MILARIALIFNIINNLLYNGRMQNGTEIIGKNGQRTLPAPVKIALGVLAGLEQERAEKLRKALPAYAMTLARQGREVTEQVLHDDLAKGDDTVMGPRPAFTKTAETIEQRYERITGKWPKPERMFEKDDPDLPLTSRLIRAVNGGNLALTQDSIRHGADIHMGDDLALRIAAQSGHLDVVKHLIDHGADIHAQDEGALSSAAEKRHYDVVRYLIDHGAKLSTFNKTVQNHINSALQNINAWMEKTGARNGQAGPICRQANAARPLGGWKELVSDQNKG